MQAVDFLEELREAAGAFGDDVFQVFAVLRQLLVGLPSLDELPHALHQQGELADVVFVVVLVLVAHARHGHDPLAVEDRHVHVPEHADVALGMAALQRIGGQRSRW